MTALNKWNKKNYKVVEVKDNQVTLERSDGTQLKIAKSDFNFNYIIKNNC